MSHKIVSQIDAAGYLTGVAIAYESPLEGDIFLIPGGAIDVEPPAEVPQGQRAKWLDGAWVFEDIQVNPVEPPPPIEPPTDDELKAACKVEAKQQLQETDFSQVLDVAEILANKAAFDAYRTAVRALFFAPVASPMWPVRPTAEWV